MEIIQKFILLNKERRLRIAVIGDAMIDEYKYGNVDRVSPEFPVPILTSHKNQEESYPGGAANVCHQMKHFNVDAFLIGFVDNDAHKLYSKQDFNTSYSIGLTTGRVPRKVRFYDGDFPLHRWDVEQHNYGEDEDILPALRDGVFTTWNALLDNEAIDAVILSDYNKGFWTDDLAQAIIRSCHDRKIISVVDPKKSLLRWRGCTIFKPNANEAKALSGGLSTTKEQIDYLQEKLDCRGVVITQSGQGVVGKHFFDHFEHWTPRKLSSKEVNSVIGAGDCFAAVMTIALTHGFSLKSSCMLAFEAGVQYVKARHNKPITPHDIYARLDHASSKILSLEDLIYLKENIYKEDEFVFTNGCFDILHTGHLQTLRFAKSKGSKLVVGLNSDDSVRGLKGPTRPIRTFEDRAALMAAIEYVDFIVRFDEPTPEETIKKLKPDYLVKGSDYKKNEVVGAEFVKEVFLAPIIPGVSTTKFLERVGIV